MSPGVAFRDLDAVQDQSPPAKEEPSWALASSTSGRPSQARLGATLWEYPSHVPGGEAKWVSGQSADRKVHDCAWPGETSLRFHGPGEGSP